VKPLGITLNLPQRFQGVHRKGNQTGKGKQKLKSKLNRKTSLALAFSATATIAVMLGTAKPAHAQWTLGQWNLGANGHYYSVQQITGITYGWGVARSQAQSLVSPNGSPVDLATSTSATENAFIFAGIDSPTYWIFAGNSGGPMLGGYQYDKLAEPSGHWAWVTGETWDFTSWAVPDPLNNYANAEDYVSFFEYGNVRSGNWNDTSTVINGIGGPDLQYYVAETTSVGVAAPEPTTLSLLALGGLGILARRRNRKGIKQA
jgi:hypothetical protein